MTDPMPEHARAAKRQDIAAAQLATYQEAQRLAWETVGRGWRPWMKVSLVPRDYHTGNNEPVAVCFKMYCGDRKTNDHAMFVRRMPDGTAKAAKSFEELFGELLTEKDTKPIVVRGQEVFPDRYCVCWAAVELYKPRSAESLKKAAVKREAKKLGEEAAGSLFADAIRAEGPVKKGRGR